jgi:hypothetical protein
MTKGTAIRIVSKGKYEGKTGWLNADMEATPKMYYVIIDMGNDATHETRLMQESVRMLETKPAASYSEATLRDHPDIEYFLEKLCRELAKCSIHKDPSGIMAIINKKLNDATEKQNSLGNKGLYRHVKFD